MLLNVQRISLCTCLHTKSKSYYCKKKKLIQDSEQIACIIARLLLSRTRKGSHNLDMQNKKVTATYIYTRLALIGY